MALRILWADDQPGVIEALEPYLGVDNPEICRVSDAHQAEVELRARKFDLCLIDLQMPPGIWGGLELLRAASDIVLLTPVAVLSGAGTLRECIEAQRLGARAYVQKERAPEELARVVQELLADVPGRVQSEDYRRVVALEVRIGRLVMNALRQLAGARQCDVFIGLMPKKIALKTYERLLEHGRGRQEDFLDLIDLRDALDSIWADSPEARSLEKVLRPRTKESRTKWIADLNEMRKLVMHPTRGGLGEDDRARLREIEVLVEQWAGVVEEPQVN